MTNQKNPPRERLEEAAQALRAGGIVAYPTEAVFGLGCDPGNSKAIRRLLSVKQRPADKGLILIAAEIPQLEGWIEDLPAATYSDVLNSWPGPVTWVVPAGPWATPLVCGNSDAIAVRVTAHPIAADLCRIFNGPVVSTSANLSGASPARDRAALYAQFGSAIDYYLDGPLGGRDRPSEIRDALTGQVLRR